jgi:hypothetical protein
MEWFQQTWAVHLSVVPVKFVVLWSWLCQYLYITLFQYSESQFQYRITKQWNVLRLTLKILSLLISLICLIFPSYLMRALLHVQNFRIYISKFRGRAGLLTYSNFYQMLRGALKFSHREDDSKCAERVSQYFIKRVVHTT